MTPPEKEILEKARDLVVREGDRGSQYGPAEEDFSLVADFFTTWVEAKYKAQIEFDAEDVAAFMILLKLRRQAFRPKEDNLIDLIGYAALAHRVNSLGSGE